MRKTLDQQCKAHSATGGHGLVSKAKAGQTVHETDDAMNLDETEAC